MALKRLARLAQTATSRIGSVAPKAGSASVINVNRLHALQTCRTDRYGPCRQTPGMPMARIKDHKIVFQCPGCTHQMRQTVGWLKANTNITCPACGTTIRLNPDKLVQSVEAMEQAFEGRPRTVQIEP